MKNLLLQILVITGFCTFASCGPAVTTPEEQTPVVSVNAEPVISGSIENEISFNGSTVYLKKAQILTPISGYIVSANARFGQEVHKGMVLFEVKTRESAVLYSASDTAIQGTVKIHATTTGFISELNVNEAGNFISEGSVLCTIENNRDLMVRLNVPFELASIPAKEKNCKIRLADNSYIGGLVYSILPSVDESNQTQMVLVKPETTRLIPENLNLLVYFIKEKHDNAMLVPRSALMTNETQSDFWVVKVIPGDTAVKIPVSIGIENDSVIEIYSHQLKVNDLVISKGAYGLPDSAIVSIAK